MTRERISRILELREILLSFQPSFNHVNAADVCAILESISGLEPSSEAVHIDNGNVHVFMHVHYLKGMYGHREIYMYSSIDVDGFEIVGTINIMLNLVATA